MKLLSFKETLVEGFHNLLAAKVHEENLQTLEPDTSEFKLTKAKFHRNMSQHNRDLAAVHAKNGNDSDAIKHSNIANFHAKREEHFSSMI